MKPTCFRRSWLLPVMMVAVLTLGAATGVMTSYNLVNGRTNTVGSDVDDVVRTWTDTTRAGRPLRLWRAGAPGAAIAGATGCGGMDAWPRPV